MSPSIAEANNLLDITAAAQFLGVSVASLRRWTNSGVLPCLRIGRRRERRFRREDLLAFMEQPVLHRRPAAGGVGANAPEVPDAPLTISEGNHLFGMYGTDVGLLSLVVPFLLEGLREGSACLLVAPKSRQKRILKTLEELLPSLSDDATAGRLVLSEHQDSITAQWKYLASQLSEAQEAGASTFRIVGDMIGLRAHVSARDLIDFEIRLDDKIIARFPVSILCVYDAREFSGLALLNALKAHRDTFRYPVGRALA